ncbi:hypothetical protein RS030_162435 [Cryptosporidium xiaoi]|uniref:WD repeat-containing protein n=1 Tax=Cryptosporidium xiaoi TaxID=659607 RepID=A0AAV9Y0R0_9CRYT
MSEFDGNVGTFEMENNGWAVSKTDEAFVMVKDNSEPFEIKSICSIPGFRVKKSWLDYLVRLEEEEKIFLLNRECKLICCSSSSDSKIRIMNQYESFTICFEILDSNTLERIEYDFTNVHGIIKQDSKEEIEYGLNGKTGKEHEIEYLFRDLILILNTGKKLLTCKIPFYVILSIYIRETILNYRKKSNGGINNAKIDSTNSSISLSLNIPNYKKTIWIYNLENKYFECNSLISCFNVNQVRPYLVAMHKKKNGSSIYICLITPNTSEFEDSIDSEQRKDSNSLINQNAPLIVVNSTKFDIKNHELCGKIIDCGIGFYPLKKSYIWIVSLSLDSASNTNIENTSREDLSLEELSENNNKNLFTKTRIYLIETLKKDIKLRGVIETFSYCIKNLSILEARCEKFEENKGLKIRIVSSTIDPFGLICFDTFVLTETNRVERMNILSLVFMPITNKEIINNNQNDKYEIENPDCPDDNINKDIHGNNNNNIELNYSFGKGSGLNSYLRKENNNTSLSGEKKEQMEVNITTFCVIPSYIHSSLGKNILDPEISNCFPLVCCGLSNGEWRIYTLKEDMLDEQKYSKKKDIVINSSNNIGYFVLKGVHILKGNEFSLINQLENKGGSKYTKVSSSCWGFERHPNVSNLTIVACNNIGNIFSWSLEGRKRGNFQNVDKNNISQDEFKSKDINRCDSDTLKSKSVHKRISDNEIYQYKTETNSNLKTKELSECDYREKGFSDTLEILDRHIRRIDERLSKVKAQEAIISRAEKCKTFLTESRKNGGISGEKENKLNKSFVPSCANRSVSPRRGCESCNKNPENDEASNENSSNRMKIFFYKSKYDDMEHKRYRGYNRDEEHECVFQLNNHFTIKHILSPDIDTYSNDSNIENNDTFNLDNAINYESIINNWKEKNTRVLYNDILFTNYFNFSTK